MSEVVTIQPTQSRERTRNPLRPETFAQVIGQTDAKWLMARAVDACFERAQPLDHVLLVGQSGTGKSTFSHVIANELGVDCYDIEAPISYDTLLQLRTTMRDGDILRLEEIHQQAYGDRRGRSAALLPETLYGVLEDRVLPSQDGPLPFPRITVIGTTTDEGALPDAFVARFPLRPVLDPYSEAELTLIAEHNARALSLPLAPGAARALAQASLGVPRTINNLIRNAVIMTAPGATLDTTLVTELLRINRVAADGLSADMTRMLTFLLARRRESAKGDVTYQASLGAIATALGKSRDTKAVTLRVEPPLIMRGYIDILNSGRALTPAGVKRARAVQ